MSDKQDIFTKHYCLLRCDAEARQHLIDDPITALKEYFGSIPAGNYRVEVIPQQPQTITIVLPAPRAVSFSASSVCRTRALSRVRLSSARRAIWRSAA